MKAYMCWQLIDGMVSVSWRIVARLGEVLKPPKQIRTFLTDLSWIAKASRSPKLKGAVNPRTLDLGRGTRGHLSHS